MAHRSEPVRASLAAAVILALGSALVAGPVVAAEWDFTPRVEASVTWTDNVTATGDGTEESEFIYALEPGFVLGVAGPRAEASLDYSAQALWYQDNSEFDDVYHRLLGQGLFTLVPNHFFVDGFARYDQENIDPAGRITSGNFFRTGNRTDAAVYGLSPWYQTRIGQWAETQLRYRYQAVDYGNTDVFDPRVQDSDTHAGAFWLGSPEARPGVSWRASVNYSRTEFESAQQFEYGQAALDVGVPVGVRSRATATVGLESDVATDPTEGGFDEAYWYLGYSWRPTRLQSFEVRVGDRYYGTAFELLWTRRGTRGDLSVEYTERPTTANQRLFDGEGVFSGGRPGTPRIDTTPYLSKRLNGRITYELVRTVLGANVYAEKRERLGDDPLAPPDDDVVGVRLTADWDAMPRTHVDFLTRYEQRDGDEFTRSGDYLEFGAGVRRDMTRIWFLHFRVAHVRRDPESGEDYSINAASLAVGAEF
ncbi:MAG TPA: TIGR03016 family PEP-CTERM system-associated outer membrane protein [Gammaproteobacteria bacterium]|nr:TIGR03016 family PEP-CTERM system-associated outer membrane protein [Gammaproteobacteria bacterium]